MPGVAWAGNLMRTGARVCQLYCRKHSVSGKEPAGWPGVVDIRMWVQLGFFMER